MEENSRYRTQVYSKGTKSAGTNVGIDIAKGNKPIQPIVG